MVLVMLMGNLVSLVISTWDCCDCGDVDEDVGKSCDFDMGFL